MITAVGDVILHVQDLERMAHWYSELLALPVTNLDPETPFYALDMAEGPNLMLDDHRFAADQTQHPLCMLKTDAIEEALAWVQQNAIPVILDMQRPHPGLAYFNILDSEGNALMLVESNWVNPAPVRPSDPEHPLKNRIGSVIIPVQNLSRASQWYARLLGQELGAASQTFTVGATTLCLKPDPLGPTFSLQVTDIEAARRWLAEKQIKTIVSGGQLVVEDPEGNLALIEL